MPEMHLAWGMELYMVNITIRLVMYQAFQLTVFDAIGWKCLDPDVDKNQPIPDGAIVVLLYPQGPIHGEGYSDFMITLMMILGFLPIVKNIDSSAIKETRKSCKKYSLKYKKMDRTRGIATIISMDGEDLFDEFGNYIGPEQPDVPIATDEGPAYQSSADLNDRFAMVTVDEGITFL